MAYDEALAERIRSLVDDEPGLVELKMFGGLVFMFHGNMAVGVMGDELLVRVGADAHAGALTEPHVSAMDMAGRSMKGFVIVGIDGITEDDDLRTWVDRGFEFAGSLPPK